MKKKLPALLVFVILIACQQVSKKEKDITMDTIAKQEINKIILDTIDDTMMLLGNINKEGLNGDDFIEWYQENYVQPGEPVPDYYDPRCRTWYQEIFN